MKVFAILFTALLSVSAFAAQPSQETFQVTRALVNNPKIVTQLQANNSANLVDMQITLVKPGIFQYNLVFNRQCKCAPSTAYVKILEDLTPTYYDGPIKYTSSITIK